jgi:SAM-dependent methyltransferase
MMETKSCPACHRDSMAVFLEIEAIPVYCGLLYASREAAWKAPEGDIRLGFCHACGMIYNLVFDPCRMQYTQGYDNSLYFSPHFQGFAQELAARLIETYQLQGKTIIEIGCGQGDFLSLLCHLGPNHGVGFDPSYAGTLSPQETPGQPTVIPDYYSERYASYQADLICCRQVLEHIHNPTDFLITLRRTIGNRTHVPVFFEVPNVLFILRRLSVWDIIYEHCSYFSEASLRYIFQACGFEVSSIYETYDGQYISVEAMPSEESVVFTKTRNDNLQSLTHDVADFANCYRNRIDMWRHRLEQIDQAHARAVVWGAGAKGLSFMSLLKCQDQIQYIVDINPRKHGMYLAGGGQQIVPPGFLCDYRPDVVIVMNPIYLHEIGQMV